MRRFDVVLIGDDGLRACLDAARMLANPNEKNAAHITVRGPFKTPPRKALKRDQITGSGIQVSGIGRFKGDHQNTIFLWCDSEYLRRIWRKRDHGYNPHITLYDGKSSKYADRLYELCLHNLKFDFSFPAGHLVSLTSRKGQTDLDLRAQFDSRLVKQLTGEKVTQEDLYEMDDERRLWLVYAILQFISKHFHQRTASSYQRRTRALKESSTREDE